MAIVYLSLGTNMGKRAANLRAALARLRPDVQIRRVSPVYETAPWGYHDQPAFLNQVIEAETNLPPRALLSYLKAIEAQLGREPTFRYGPRLIDLDILFYDSQVMRDETLSLPHPNLHERAFVLVPLADLSPDLLHPVRKQTVSELLKGVDTSGVTRVMPKMPAFGTRTFLMGILNVTPDSFSGDGLLASSAPKGQALRQARAFVQAGADILDVGGESTRPGAETVDEQAEIERVVPVIEALRREFDCLISVDTYKSSVARAALQAGADWINDIWGLRADPEMGKLAAHQHAPVVLMHNRLKPGQPGFDRTTGQPARSPPTTKTWLKTSRRNCWRASPWRT